MRLFMDFQTAVPHVQISAAGTVSVLMVPVATPRAGVIRRGLLQIVVVA